jgi:hypothetical protein
MTLPFTLPFTLPDWLPAWAFLLLALPVLLWLLAFLMVPFSVFGVKARLENLEAQIESLQEDMRGMSARAVTGAVTRARADDYDDIPNFGRIKSAQTRYEPVPTMPPIPPAPLTPMAPRAEEKPAPRLPARPARRTEPRLD